MSSSLHPKAVMFDAYGTLLDVHSVIRDAGAEFPESLSKLWRQKQLEYTWLRSLMDRYKDFWDVTEEALRAAAEQLQITLDSAQIDRLMQAYLRPSAFPDAQYALEKLKGRRLAILSNGSTKMLQAAVRHNGLDACLDEIISVERVRIYKPSRMVYALGPTVLRVPASDILFVSSNAWDAAGAKAYGYTVCWCNRSAGHMEQLGLEPDLVVTALDQLAEMMVKI